MPAVQRGTSKQATRRLRRDENGTRVGSTGTMAEAPEIRVEIAADGDADEDALAEMSGHLRRRLMELPVRSVERAPAGAAPEGARSGELFEVATLVVTLIGGAESLRSLVSALGGWSAERRRRVRVTIGEQTLEIIGGSTEEELRLIEAWEALQSESRRER